MLQVRESGPTRLVLDSGRGREIVGLLLLCLGLLGLGIGLACMDLISARRIIVLCLVSCFLLVVPGIVLAFFATERWVFDRKAGRILAHKPFRRTRSYALADVERVELWRAWFVYQSLGVRFKDGSRLAICEGMDDQARAWELAQDLASFLGAAWEAKSLTS